jgi:phenylacetate-CoA ligase
MSWEAVYLRLPVWLQNLACSREGRRIQRTRYGSEFEERLKQAEQRSEWPAERIAEFRDARLRDFVRHAAEYSAFYRWYFRLHGVDPRCIRGLDDLKRLPVLTKEDVQAHHREMLALTVPKRRLVMAHTSGTTGGGLRFVTTADGLQEQWAVWWRYRRWHGIQPGTWCGYFAGRSVVPALQTRPPFWRYNYPGRQILFSGYHVSPANLPAYLARLRRSKPPWLHGYPSLLAPLAAHLLDVGGDLGYQVRWITLGAENLLAQQAEVIRRAFGVTARQHYGLAEAVANISQCPEGRLHVDEDFAATEFLPNHDGIGYRVVGTNVSNPATPMLRYDTQDVVSLSEESCSCGRPGRIVQGIDGRQEDYVMLPNGSRLGRMDHIFKDHVHIREAQIHQPRVGAITIRVVKRDGYSEADEQRLIYDARVRIGDDTEITIDYVDRLQRNAQTGKLRLVVSDVSQGKLGGLFSVNRAEGSAASKSPESR